MLTSVESSLSIISPVMVPSSDAVVNLNEKNVTLAAVTKQPHEGKENITPEAIIKATKVTNALAEKIVKLNESLPTLVPSPPTETKTIEIILTKEKLEKIKAEKKRNGKRLISQNKVMGEISAAELMEALGLAKYSGRGWEWLHLVAYCFLGEVAQISENLAAGTNEANTKMMFPERAIKKLVEDEGFEIKLTLQAILLTSPDGKLITHVGKEFIMDLEFLQPDDKLSAWYKQRFVFDAFQTIAPTKYDWLFFKKWLEVSIQSCARKIIELVDAKKGIKKEQGAEVVAIDGSVAKVTTSSILEASKDYSFISRVATEGVSLGADGLGLIGRADSISKGSKIIAVPNNLSPRSLKTFNASVSNGCKDKALTGNYRSGEVEMGSPDINGIPKYVITPTNKSRVGLGTVYGDPTSTWLGIYHKDSDGSKRPVQRSLLAELFAADKNARDKDALLSGSPSKRIKTDSGKENIPPINTNLSVVTSATKYASTASCPSIAAGSSEVEAWKLEEFTGVFFPGKAEGSSDVDAGSGAKRKIISPPSSPSKSVKQNTGSTPSESPIRIFKISNLLNN